MSMIRTTNVALRGGLEHDPEAAALVGRRSAAFTEEGYKAFEWAHRRGTPGAVKTDYGYYRDGPLIGWWWDHAYRLVQTRDGNRRTIFVAEPYQILNRDLLQLGGLSNEGWTITIATDLALWYPGHTIAIWLERSVP